MRLLAVFMAMLAIVTATLMTSSSVEAGWIRRRSRRFSTTWTGRKLCKQMCRSDWGPLSDRTVSELTASELTADTAAAATAAAAADDAENDEADDPDAPTSSSSSSPASQSSADQAEYDRESHEICDMSCSDNLTKPDSVTSTCVNQCYALSGGDKHTLYDVPQYVACVEGCAYGQAVSFSAKESCTSFCSRQITPGNTPPARTGTSVNDENACVVECKKPPVTNNKKRRSRWKRWKRRRGSRLFGRQFPNCGQCKTTGLSGDRVMLAYMACAKRQGREHLKRGFVTQPQCYVKGYGRRPRRRVRRRWFHRRRRFSFAG